MSQRNAIVIVIDRFGAGYLGPYGNTWIETPTLNRLASEAMLWENAYADCPTLDGFYRAVAGGRHAWSEPAVTHREQLIARIAASGVRTTLVTDEPNLGSLPFASGFGERVCLPEADGDRPADSIEATRIAHALAAALDYLDSATGPFLLWLHLRGMSGAWDAPREFRESLADEQDPAPPEFVEPPCRLLPENPDPDELLGVSQAYAGQVLLCDACLAPLIQSVSAGQYGDNTLVVLTSPRGFPLGERGGLGPCGDGLYEEVIHIPLLVRHPQRRNAMQRIQSLVQPADLYFTIGEWFCPAGTLPDQKGVGLLTLAEQSEPRQREGVASVFGEQRSLRTPAWLLRQTGSSPPSLYVKPADRWEVNEVADRCGEVVEESLRALAAYEHWLRADGTGELPPLSNLLLNAAE